MRIKNGRLCLSGYHASQVMHLVGYYRWLYSVRSTSKTFVFFNKCLYGCTNCFLSAHCCLIFFFFKIFVLYSKHILSDLDYLSMYLSYFSLIRHMLMIVDNEEFYEQEKPLSLTDIRSLIIILRQVRYFIIYSCRKD